jgi:tetratricopeptide (TPR) repeat protein
MLDAPSTGTPARRLCLPIRERLHQEALRAWIAQDFSARAAAWEQILVNWPLDLLALRQHTGTLFWTGDKRHQAEVTVGGAGHWDPRTPGYAHFLSAHAFAMEEVGQYTVAERCARKALALQPQDLWALHGLVHVFEMQGRVPEGIELLSDAARFLNGYNLFRGHLWWHLSLFKFSQGRFDEVLDLFDREVYPKSSTFYIDVQNGASLLARLEFQGIDVGLARWERLAQAYLLSATQSTLWFTSMHHVMALMRSGRVSAVQSAFEYLQLCRTAPYRRRWRELLPRRLFTRTSPAKRLSGCWPYASATGNSVRATSNKTSTTRSWSWLPCS